MVVWPERERMNENNILMLSWHFYGEILGSICLKGKSCYSDLQPVRSICFLWTFALNNEVFVHDYLDVYLNVDIDDNSSNIIWTVFIEALNFVDFSLFAMLEYYTYTHCIFIFERICLIILTSATSEFNQRNIL